MFSRLFNKKLSDALNVTKEVKISGVLFKIKAISVLEHLTGSNALVQSYSTYGAEKLKSAQPNIKKLKDHYADVILASVIKPKITRKAEGAGTCVYDMFDNWDMCTELYEQIMLLTYGKKKLKQHGYQGKSSLN